MVTQGESRHDGSTRVRDEEGVLFHEFSNVGIAIPTTDGKYVIVSASGGTIVVNPPDDFLTCSNSGSYVMDVLDTLCDGILPAVLDPETSQYKVQRQ